MLNLLESVKGSTFADVSQLFYSLQKIGLFISAHLTLSRPFKMCKNVKHIFCKTWYFDTPKGNNYGIEIFISLLSELLEGELGGARGWQGE